ncbi:spore coat protein CotH [Paenibacillus sp. 1011MAR3C5]|uniref:CotH kinase family protein n=1 Tax=Paenibacillus sp. 1011MAR3C5 TaxID=1675787 RepID=UPI000E6C4273|nr:CotH kinase family protein [Paenibacillus sp. 1011MAR3C5]RJE90956.1 spore coat protein CotH [Paenibacillus sp. 1011MAR3C5]
MGAIRQYAARLMTLLIVVALVGVALAMDTGVTGTFGAQTVSANEQLLDERYFPQDKIVDVKITVDPDDFQDMLDNAAAEQFKQATVEYNGETFENAAIRTKGNLSLNSVVNMADSDRYSFKISFDEYVNQTLGGISKVNLNNNYSDNSYMQEFLSYELAEEMGLPTPKRSYVNVYVNGELWGFYLAVEQIGDAYLERHFGKAYGTLYKANGGNGSELTWLETAGAYTGLDVKSDKRNDEALLAMLDELNNGSSYDQVLNTDNALKYIALNAVIGNMDSYLSEKKHNYYLYELNGMFSVLPWDYNMAFGGFGGSSILIDEPTTGAVADRPLVSKLLAVDAYKERYHEIISEMLDGYLESSRFEVRVAELKAMISEYVKADPTAFVTYEQYEQGVQQLLSFTETQTASIAKQLDGTEPSSGDGSGSGSRGFGGGGFGGGMGRPGGQAGANGNVNTDANTNADGNAGLAQQGGEMPEGFTPPEGGFPGGEMPEDFTPPEGGFPGGTTPEARTLPENDSSGSASSSNGNVQAANLPSRQSGQFILATETNAQNGSSPQQSTPNASQPEGGVNGTAQRQNTPNAGQPADPNGNAQGQNAPDSQNGNAQQDPNAAQSNGNEAGRNPQGGFQGQAGQGGFMGGARPEGMGGLGGGRFPGDTAALNEGSEKEAIMAAISAALLLLSCLFIVFYKRRKL